MYPVKSNSCNPSEQMYLVEKNLENMDKRTKELEEKISKIRVFGIDDVLQNRIIGFGKISAYSLVTCTMLYLLKRL